MPKITRNFLDYFHTKFYVKRSNISLFNAVKPQPEENIARSNCS